MMKRIFLAGLALLLLALSPAAGAAPNRETAVGFQLDTVITLTAYCDRQVLEDARPDLVLVILIIPINTNIIPLFYFISIVFII